MTGTLWLVVAGTLVGLAALAGAGYWARRHLVVITVRGTSMLPVLEPGDRVLIRRIGISGLRKGQIVVARPGRPMRRLALDDPLLVIKRVVAVPGDPVPRSAVPALRDVPESTVPPEHFVVLGDNPAGTDSRQLGYFHGSYLIGVVIRPVARRSPETGPPGTP